MITFWILGNKIVLKINGVRYTSRQTETTSPGVFKIVEKLRRLYKLNGRCLFILIS